jgi:iron-sulfur cluster repair protein YtfE (RIC family)
MRPPLPFPSLAHPIRVMEADHARLDQVRADARAAIGAAAGPPERWAGFVQAFARLDAALESHARYENEVLFPRALELEARMI